MDKVIVDNKWIYPLADKEVEKTVEKLSKETGLSKEEVIIFYNRRIRTAKEIKRFINLGMKDLLDPRGLKDIEKVSEAIIRHGKAGNLIVLYSDYDADGCFSVVVFLKLLRALGFNVEYFTNDRDLGYGIQEKGADLLLEKFPDVKLIVTADNGIVAIDAIKYVVEELKIEVCVTDHHEPLPSGIIPNCTGVVNPKRFDDTYPFKGLCGTAVIYKLCRLIYEDIGMDPRKCDEMLDFVAIATVADVMPLLEENRVFVKEGLNIINREDKNIWKYMKEVLMNPMYETSVNSKTIGFTYGPAVNACSRLLGNMDIPLKAFLLDDSNPANENDIKNTIKHMQSINEERKELSNNQTVGTMNVVEEFIDDPIYVVWHEELHEGIVGIIAGRICEKFNKPTIIMTRSKDDPSIWKGSGRSVEGFNIKEVLDEIQDETGLINKYGGHEGACGLSIEEKNLNSFKIEILLKADELISNNPKTTVIDLALKDEEYSIEIYDRMKALEPFGQDFPEPVYGIREFSPKFSESFGGDEKIKHVKFTGENIIFVGWNCGEDWIEDGKPNKDISVIGELGYNDYSKKMQLTTRSYTDIYFDK